MPKSQVVDSFRRKPRQSRSEASVAAILEAAARILNKPAKARFNTNTIAELAGISIGTLYQYFPDKNAILVALAREQLEATSQAVLKALRSDVVAAESLEQDPVRACVRALIYGFRGRQRTRKFLIEAMIANGLSKELERPVEAVYLHILSLAHASVSLTPVRLYVMTRAVAGLLRAAVLEQSPWLEDQSFEDELVTLVHFYLGDADALLT